MLNLLSNIIKTIQIISLLNMWLRLIIWLKCNKTKTTPIAVLNINHLIKLKYGGCCILKYRMVPRKEDVFRWQNPLLMNYSDEQLRQWHILAQYLFDKKLLTYKANTSTDDRRNVMRMDGKKISGCSSQIMINDVKWHFI